jgi:hypothetical protein
MSARYPRDTANANLMNLTLLPDTFAIAQLPPGSPVPFEALGGPLSSVVSTPEELSIVCLEANAPEGAKVEGGWRALEVEGPMSFDLTGVVSSITTPLAAAGIGVFVISTFNTDYVLVRQPQLDAAIAALRTSGFLLS